MDSRLSKACFAEALLALVTNRERAEAIAGDLVEETGAGQRWRFGFHLLSISCSLLVAGIGMARWRSLWLFAAGFALWFFVYVTIRAGGALAGVHPLDDRGIDCLATPLGANIYLAAALLASNFVTGAVLGARTPAGALNAGVPLAAFWALCAVAAPVAAWLTASATWHCTLFYLLGLPLLYVAPLLCGAAWSRHRCIPA